ncbi:hypothetical protein MXB_2987, partial [Myxobolus squamalis]
CLIVSHQLTIPCTTYRDKSAVDAPNIGFISFSRAYSKSAIPTHRSRMPLGSNLTFPSILTALFIAIEVAALTNPSISAPL